MLLKQKPCSVTKLTVNSLEVIYPHEIHSNSLQLFLINLICLENCKSLKICPKNIPHFLIRIA